MRLQSKSPVTVRDRVIGGPQPLICLPLVAADRASLLKQADEATAHHPDLIEWRVDKYAGLENPDSILAVLAALRERIGEIPLIFTCRALNEGGLQDIAEDVRRGVNAVAIASGHVDIIDTELGNSPAMIGSVREAARQRGVKLILSYHSFTRTPAKRVILERLIEAQALEADIAKVAVMPQSYEDVLTLLGATLEARTGVLAIPLVTMAMGAKGILSRIAGGLFGSDITFGVGGVSSAPGQIPIDDLRKAWSVLPFA